MRDPSTADDFGPLKGIPIEEPFHLDCTIPLQEDPSITATRRKQARLATLHEALGHFSFDRLKLLARAGLSPRHVPDALMERHTVNHGDTKVLRISVLSRLLPHPVTSSAWIN